MIGPKRAERASTENLESIFRTIREETKEQD